MLFANCSIEYYNENVENRLKICKDCQIDLGLIRFDNIKGSSVPRADN